MAIPINEDPYHAAHINVWPSKDDLDLPVLYYRPHSLMDIVSKTKFSRREVQLIYRSFKQLCPSGIIQQKTFQEIYSQFFPHGDTRHYSSLIFKTLDRGVNGSINFEDFVMALSTIKRGSIEDKLDWVFSLYDVHNRGFITEAEMLHVTESIYSLLSKQLHGQTAREEILRHGQEVFLKLTNNGLQKAISRRQFIDMCLKDQDLCTSFANFDTKL